MKNLSLSALLTATLVFVGFAQVTAAGAEPKAEITFTKTTHDFGALPHKGNGSYEFEFTNTGTAPLILHSVHSGCGCAVPSFSREPIAPGGKGSVKVVYDTSRSGPINRAVTVNSNADATPAIVLYIRGSVAPAAEAAQ